MDNKIKLDEENQEIRINKFLSEAGVCSRREADKLILSGKVWIDNKPATLGMLVSKNQKVEVDGKPISNKLKTIILMVNKPAGIVCTEEKREKNNIINFVNYPTRITYAGRLDKNSRGLLLMTNNGDLINQMMRSKSNHEKEYKVTVDKEVTEDFLKKISSGVPILDTVTKSCQVKKIGKYTFTIILTQGLNRQIRRMCEALGYQVKDLVRTRILNLKLADLKEGSYRQLTDEETKELYRQVGHIRHCEELGDEAIQQLYRHCEEPSDEAIQQLYRHCEEPSDESIQQLYRHCEEPSDEAIQV